MKIHKLQQGTPEWHEFRAAHFPASEAPKMMGKSQYGSRSAYLYERATGKITEPTEFQQKLFARGHAAEDAARPLAEVMLDDEVLYPVTITNDAYPRLSASLDGRTDDGKTIWEHKLWGDSDKLATSVMVGDIHQQYHIQVQQQLMLSGAERCLFMVSDGTDQRCVTTWIYPDLELQQQIVEGWSKFADELASYDPTASNEFKELEKELAKVKDDQGLLKEKEESIVAAMKEIAGGQPVKGEIFQITYSERKGSIAWNKAVEKFGLTDMYDFESFRGKPTTITTIKRINQ